MNDPKIYNTEGKTSLKLPAMKLSWKSGRLSTFLRFTSTYSKMPFSNQCIMSRLQVFKLSIH